MSAPSEDHEHDAYLRRLIDARPHLFKDLADVRWGAGWSGDLYGEAAAALQIGTQEVQVTRRKLLWAGVIATVCGRAESWPAMTQTLLIEGVSRTWPATDRAMVAVEGTGQTACAVLARLAAGHSIRGVSDVGWTPCTHGRARQALLLIRVGEAISRETPGMAGGQWNAHLDLAAAPVLASNVQDQVATAEAIATMVFTEAPVAVDMEDVCAAIGTRRVAVTAACAASGHGSHVRAALGASAKLQQRLAKAAGVLVSISTRSGGWSLGESKAALNAVRQCCNADATVIYGLGRSSNLRYGEVLVTVIAAG